jgi:hypothetical protein
VVSDRESAIGDQRPQIPIMHRHLFWSDFSDFLNDFSEWLSILSCNRSQTDFQQWKCISRFISEFHLSNQKQRFRETITKLIAI